MKMIGKQKLRKLRR